MGSPNILFDVKAHQFYSQYNLSDDRQKRSAFYRCKDANNSVIGYLTRDTAVEKEDFENIEKMNTLIENTSTSNKEDILTYVTDRPGSTGLWDANGDITSKEKVKEYRNEMRITESTIWSGVISFKPEYSADNCSNKVEAQKMVAETINKFFKKAKLDPSNMNWFGAFHINTAHPHCHILFWEKQKNKIDSKGNLTFAKWKLPPSSLKEYPAIIQQYFDRQKSSSIEGLKLRDENRKALRYNLRRKNLEFEFQTLSEQLSDIESYQYARISKENQKIINDFVDKIIETNPSLKANDQLYKESLTKQQQSLIQSFKDNNIEVNNKVLNFTSDRIEEYYSRLGNEVLSALKFYRRIQEEIEEMKTHTPKERKTLDEIHQRLHDTFIPSKITTLDNTTCIRQLQQKGYLLNDSEPEENFKENETEEEAHLRNLKMMKKYNPVNLQPFDRTVLNEYGIDYISKDSRFKLVNSKKDGLKKIYGDYTKYTFINASGKTKDYYLLNDNGLQHSFPDVLKSLGLNNKDILNIINKCDKNNLLPNLILKTGHFNLNWFASKNQNEKSYYQKDKFNTRKFFGQDRKLIYNNKRMKMFFDVQIDQNFMFLLNSVNEEQENRIDLMRRSMLQREGDELDDEQEK